jgi:coatomer subunit epsilon
LIGQAVSELHLGRTPEAEAAFQQAIDIDSKNADLLANLIVLNTVLGKDTTETITQLRDVSKEHQILVDLEAKMESFDAAASKYTPKFEP